MLEKTTSEAFPSIGNRINKLTKITDKYLFEDLVQAIFCINICINNRSTLESCLALNACLLEHKNEGTKEIKTYSEFSEFFSKIYDICKPTIFDDYTVEDFGEVRINYKNVFYRVIVGTGHNNVFACINFLPSVARITNQEKELTLVFEYSSNVIEYFIDVNKNDEAEEPRFVLPSSELYDKTKIFFNEEVSKYNINDLSCIFDANHLIEKKHFIIKKSGIYPVFNASILVDLYDLWESRLTDEQKIDVVNNGIFERVFSLFELDRSVNCEMYAPAKLFFNGEPSKDTPVYTFVAKGNNGVVIAINIDEYTEETLTKEIDRINKLHKSNQLEFGEIYDRFESGILRGFSIKSDFPIVFLLYNSFSNPNQMTFISGEPNSRKKCTALDVIYYLNFMDNIDELFEYLTYSPENEFEQVLGFGSDAAFFFTRKNQQRYISKGAIKFSMLDVGYDTENVGVVEYFKNELKAYPFISDDHQFSEPFAWKIVEFESDSFEIYVKYGTSFGGRLIPLDQDNYIFQANNIEFYKDVKNIEDYRQIHQVLNEIIDEGVNSLKEIFSDNRIQLMFMPIEYAKNIEPTSFLNEDRVYCYSDAFYYDGKWIIKFVVKDKVKIFADLESATNRSVELKILEEILLPILERRPKLNLKFKSKVLSLSKCPKMIGVFTKEIDYIWNDYSKLYSPESHHFHEVRKRIAILCNSNNISPGVYKGRDANRIIRSMQKSLIEDFEKEVSKFSGIALHRTLLDYYSFLLHSIHINRARYGSYQNLDIKKDIEVRERIINRREESKNEARKVLYLIETNLYLNSESQIEPESDSILFVLAYANWLILLSDVADMCYFTQDEAYIEVSEDFTVDTIPFNTEEENNELLKRIYNNNIGLSRDEVIDSNYFGKIKTSFAKDTGLDFEIFLGLLTYFSSGFDEQIVQKVGFNVYSSSRDVLLNDFINIIDLSIELSDANKYLEYLIIDEKKLKIINNKADFYLPIGNKNDRENRFDVRPIFSYGEEIIFSPITFDNLKREWINELFNFMIPYRSNLPKTVQTLFDWKREYENKIVYDLENIFSNQNFALIKTNFELKKLGKVHPQELGDYDIFAIDEINKNVWIVECKVIMLVSTFFDMYTQQNRFFNEQKEDEKFQKRIDYLNKNLSVVLQQLGYINPEEYKVKPFMCVNKVFLSRYKNISFPIVSYSEMVDRIKKSRHETYD